jgi:probable F420-dependent oxidoreductase
MAAAAATSRLRIGTGVCLVVEHDPITTAKSVASVDRLSGGRFIFGVGGGWNREEMANHGTDPRTRMRLMGERVQAMRAIWTRDEAEFHGDFVDFDPIWSWPKPIQVPLPVFVGGMGPTVEDRVLEFGDGWLAQAVDNSNAPQFADRVAKLRERASAAGRSEIPVHMFDASPNVLEAYADAGVDEVNFVLPDRDPSGVLAELDRLGGLVG